MIKLTVLRIIRDPCKSAVILHLTDHQKDIFFCRTTMVFSFHIRYRCLDHCLLLFFCQDLIRRHMVNLAKHPVIDPMKCPECHRVISCTHPLPESLFHLLDRIFGKSDDKNLLRPDLQIPNHPFQTSRDDSRLSGSRSCQYHTGSVPVADSLFLCFIKIGKRGFFSPAVLLFHRLFLQ